MRLYEEQVEQFHQDGFLILRQVIDAALVSRLLDTTRNHVNARIEPFELEASLPYPNSPDSEDSPGGDTIRRLLQAFDRDPVYREWATSPDLVSVLHQLFGNDALRLTRAHHNCIMTKRPEYSSDTLWHRDTRYWNFSDNHLINAWLPLVSECKINGGLKIIPGSWQVELDDRQLDDEKFLRSDLNHNRVLIDAAVQVDLDPGDLLLFHARSLHAASRNHTDTTKYSVVFSYHGNSTTPVADSNSERIEEIALD